MTQSAKSVAPLRLSSTSEGEKACANKSRHPFSSLFENTRNVFKADELGLEIAVIALPALMALASDPFALLVDTVFIGHLGPVELGAVGVSISVINLVSKMFNLPLLNITTSFVAEDASANDDLPLKPGSPVQKGLLSSEGLNEAEDCETPESSDPSAKPCLPSVSSALVLGTALGLGEAVILSFFAGPILTVMGVNARMTALGILLEYNCFCLTSTINPSLGDLLAKQQGAMLSPMRLPAAQFLMYRAVGAPALVVALAIQGVFRGLKDTKTPLYATVAGNVVNIVLDPFLIFTLKLGVRGAAISTIISQYVILVWLLWVLALKVTLLPPRKEDLRLGRFLKSGGYLLARTVAILVVMTLSTSMAARQGVLQMAGHQICLQIWLAASLLSDSMALAGQAIIATAFAKLEYKRVKEASFRILQIGFVFGVFIAVLLGATMPTFSRVFTTDVHVMNVIKGLIPVVALTQPINSLAFVIDGLHYGASDFAYAAYSMILVAVPSVAVLFVLPRFWGLQAVWVGLTFLMSLRLGAGLSRLGSATGPWAFLKEDDDVERDVLVI